MKTKLLVILTACILMFTGCSSVVKPIKEAFGAKPPVPKADDIKPDELAEKLAIEEAGSEKKAKQLRIGIMPFEYTVETGYSKSQEAFQTFAETIIKRKTFKPMSLKFWLGEDVNKKTAQNIFQIIDRAKQTDIQVDYICHGRIFKSGHDYGIFIELYPVRVNAEPSYYYRNFVNFGSIKNVCNDIINEMEKRSLQTAKPAYDKKIFVRRFRTNYYTFSNLKEGERSLIKIPYITIDGSSYKTDDNFFSDILLYNLHISRLFSIWTSNIKDHVISDPVIPKDIGDIIDVDMDVSTNVSMLTVRIIDNNTNTEKFKYQYPFRSLQLNELNKVMRENAKIITMNLLNDEERKRIGVVNLESLDTQQKVYCENYYIGEGRQYDLVYPVGASVLSIGDDLFKVYVSPFIVNSKVYNINESYLLDIKK